MQPIKNAASVGILDAQTISIFPWDKSLIHPITKAINDAGVGLNPQTMADSILIRIPQLTEERRKEMVKVVKKFTEEGKVSVRNIRADFHKQIKKQEIDKEISEDIARNLEIELQKLIEETNKKIEESGKKKEGDIMKV
jgi:ribosome recycling factor